MPIDGNHFANLYFSDSLDDNDLEFNAENFLDGPVFDETIPEILPVLPLKNTVLFPGVMIPIAVSREKSIKVIRKVYKSDKILAILAQKNYKDSDPVQDQLYTTGTVAKIARIFQMPDDSITVIMQGIKRFKVKEFIPNNNIITVAIEQSPEFIPDITEEYEAILGSLKDLSMSIIQLSNIPQEATFAIRNIEDPSFLVNFISSNTDIDVSEKQGLLEIDDMFNRGKILHEYLGREVKRLELKDNIQNKVRGEMDKQQREYFLNQQIKEIQTELGNESAEQEIKQLREKAAKKLWSKEVKETFEKELKRFESMGQSSPDHSMQLTYLQTLLELPWNEYTKDNLDLVHAKKILNKEHFGLEKIKERILEYLAVLKLKGDLKSPIICLYGPPGVGKTSLGKSIAHALKRKYVRMSLGGLHDEAEIRGHRKTYIGAMPGRIIQNLKKAKSSNPVFVLDEIDKIGNDFRGNPSFALLEVLDPEQNSTFYDNYLELEFDLSKILFVATANNINSINYALRDRMELINVSGYILEEKTEIARKHLIPKQMEAHGVAKNQLQFSKDSIEFLIENYTRESGVRELDNKIARLIRIVAKKIGLNEEYSPQIKKDDVRKLLGTPKFFRDKLSSNDIAGVVIGLAWTSVGGEILFVETSISRGRGALTLTGNLGEVMKESAVIALEYLKSRADELEINFEVFEKCNIHIHIPEGAIPKDGPSAGITLFTSLASAFSQRKVRENLAMTGEITLRGKVLPVGGIKEKILAAKRVGIKDIVLSKENEKDIKSIKDIYIKGITFHYVENIMEVLDAALLPEKVSKPLAFLTQLSQIKNETQVNTNPPAPA